MLFLRLFYQIPPLLIRIYPSLIFAFNMQFSLTNNQGLNQTFVLCMKVTREKDAVVNQYQI
jgi:hypothetical protein